MTLKSMNLDMIQDLWEQDSKIDDDNLHSESTKIPSLHSKYYKLYNNILVLKKSQENKYKILKKRKMAILHW
jgi:alanine dehydrogenase